MHLKAMEVRKPEELPLCSESCSFKQLRDEVLTHKLCGSSLWTWLEQSHQYSDNIKTTLHTSLHVSLICEYVLIHKTGSKACSGWAHLS